MNDNALRLTDYVCTFKLIKNARISQLVLKLPITKTCIEKVKIQGEIRKTLKYDKGHRL